MRATDESLTHLRTAILATGPSAVDHSNDKDGGLQSCVAQGRDDNLDLDSGEANLVLDAGYEA